MAATGLPFDDIRKLMQDLPAADPAAAAQCKARDAQLTKPPGSLGKLESMAEWVAAWQGTYPPKIARPVVAVFAGNHGVVAQGVAAYPAEVTKQMVLNFQGGGAAVNQICKTFDLGLKVFELALEKPTNDITREAAMDEADCAATMAYGMEAIAGGCDLLCIGEMGIGNTTIAAAICHGLYGGRPEDWVGPGTGVDAEGLKRKASAVARAVALHKAHLSDPLEVLRRLGGRELAAMAGAILAARTQRVPVLIDGYVASAAAAVLHAMRPDALDHCLAAHCSAEPAHRNLLKRLGKEPVLDLGMRLGEASGAALAAGLLKAAVNLHNDMATF
ncbi:MAG TPA: nicotinate-nucleotide--dimethylbenzimidazole phosphoribosyltransferase, partial [Aestuariivirga sp.]|nr:nicotinate-nucleotide--dimethylbenzimidazole phosphoribosyltransferase [Aestuariivirga sp.]